MGSEQTFVGSWRVPAVSRLADVRDWKFEVLVLYDCFHRHQTFATLSIHDRLADLPDLLSGDANWRKQRATTS